ncbi:MAG TPA: hypothetical protein VGF24_36740 [Vicinamibacterales bacterium]|jgi:hypothetical protein
MKRQITGAQLLATVAVLLGFIASVGAQGGGGFGAPPPADPNAPTPRLANGKPDLTGSWGGAVNLTGAGAPGVTVGDMFRRCTPFQSKNCMEWTNQSEDWPFMSGMRLDMRQPMYKPEYWDKIIELDQWTNREDPVMTCLPLGVPRQGPPARIFATDTDVTFIYRAGVDGAGGYAEFRMIPIDGKPHDPRRANNYTYFGYTVGRWEGDTLVLDSIGFSDETWLGRGGFFHTDKMRAIEKFTRTGNQMLYEVTIEDPDVLLQPWAMPARTLRLSATNAIVGERGSCTETEHNEVSTQYRH